MLNFDKDRFVKIQTGTLSIAGEVRALGWRYPRRWLS